MRNEVTAMVNLQRSNSPIEAVNALKEAIQELVLKALSKTDFFNRAAFYGETALRIFHGLPRFSEDMDFSLVKPDPTFRLSAYFRSIEEELSSYGFELKFTSKEKRTVSPIQSAFLKGNTEYHLIKFLELQRPVSGVARNSIITINLEVDVDPPDGATFERRFRLLPSPYSTLLYDAPSLFAGKLHALLYRKWATREKGRDFYDYVWYLQHKIPVNLPHLEERMRQSGDWMNNDKLTKADLMHLLHNRFLRTDYHLVTQDILPFIKDSSSLDLYGTDFFNSITDEYLQIVQ